MNAARPTVEQERWLAATSRLRGSIDADPELRASIAARTGGWRTTGPLARIALFVLGTVAALLMTGLVLTASDGANGATPPWLIAALLVVAAGEYLIRVVRLHASGAEEALVLCGAALLAAWAAGTAELRYALPSAVAAATMLAGLRLLNPLAVAAGAFVLVIEFGTSDAARAFDGTVGAGTTGTLLVVIVTAAALGAGSRTWARPSHDRVLDWTVAALPLLGYAWLADWSGFDDRLVLRDALHDGPAVALAYAALGGTALVVGLRRRTHAPMLCFLGCVAVIAIELRNAGDLPAWMRLVLWGALAMVAAIAVDRMLRTPRRGFTSERFGRSTGVLDLLQLAGASALAQRSAPAEPAPRDDFMPGGGRYGGGGSSGSY